MIRFPGSLQGDSTVVGTSKLRGLYERFEEELGRRQTRAKAARPQWEPPKTKLDEDPGERSRWACWAQDWGGGGQEMERRTRTLEVVLRDGRSLCLL